MPIIFKGNEKYAYRDPACIFAEGVYHLFFTISEKCDGYMYNFVAHSTSRDLKSFSEPEIITERDKKKNFCSPGDVIRVGDKYRIFVTSYPMPDPFSVRWFADDSARLFFIETEDFVHFSEPERIYPKGKGCTDEGRMIDPYVIEDKGDVGRFLLLFKQNGVSISESRDLVNWKYLGRIDGGENACVVSVGDKYVMLHSPENGIGVKESHDLASWCEVGVFLPKESLEEWASGRLTAAFAMENPDTSAEYKYIVFFHGSVSDSYPETHGKASLAMYFTNDFKEYKF